MPRLPKIRPHKQRTPPPAASSAPARPSLVGCAAYIDGRRVEGCNDPESAMARVAADGSGFVWVGLFEPTQEDMAGIAGVFNLHELAAEDAVHAFQRPKLERYPRYTEFVIKTVCYLDHPPVGGTAQPDVIDIVETGEILMFLGERFIVTVRHGNHSELTGLRAALEADPEQLAFGPGAVMHAIADRVVDQYLSVVQEVERDIDQMESEVFNPKSSVSSEQIYLLKREVLELRRSVAPLRKPLQTLANDTAPWLPRAIGEYFRDVEDHLLQVTEQITTFDDLLTTLLNASLAEVAIQQNVDMRKISSWAAIALAPTAIAGIYGMNFEHMPELHWPFGYPMAIGLMLLVCIALYRALHKRNWL